MSSQYISSSTLKAPTLSFAVSDLPDWVTHVVLDQDSDDGSIEIWAFENEDRTGKRTLYTYGFLDYAKVEIKRDYLTCPCCGDTEEIRHLGILCNQCDYVWEE